MQIVNLNFCKLVNLHFYMKADDFVAFSARVSLA